MNCVFKQIYVYIFQRNTCFICIPYFTNTNINVLKWKENILITTKLLLHENFAL